MKSGRIEYVQWAGSDSDRVGNHHREDALMATECVIESIGSAHIV